MSLLKQELAIQVTNINGIQINLNKIMKTELPLASDNLSTA